MNEGEFRRSFLAMRAVGVGLLSGIVCLIGAGDLFEIGAKASRIEVEIDNTGYYARLESSGMNQGLKMELTPTPGGKLAAVMDRVNLKTNSKVGYKIYLSAENEQMFLSGETTTEAEKMLMPAAGTANQPLPLAENSWGFGMASGAAGLAIAGLSERYYQPGVSANGFGQFEPIAETKWVKVPKVGMPMLRVIDNKTRALPEGDNYEFYYGAKVGMGVTEGAYRVKIFYTAAAEATGGMVGSINPTVVRPTGGEEVTITLPVYTTYVPQFGVAEVKIGGQSCTNLRVSQEQKANLVMKCLTPALPAGQIAPVVVSLPMMAEMVTISGGLKYED